MEIPINKEKTTVNAIKSGKAHFLNNSVAHAMKQDMAINNTDKIISAGILTNIFWNSGLL